MTQKYMVEFYTNAGFRKYYVNAGDKVTAQLLAAAIMDHEGYRDAGCTAPYVTEARGGLMDEARWQEEVRRAKAAVEIKRRQRTRRFTDDGVPID